MHTLPKINFQFSDFEPVIDAATMEIHFSKHHQAYVDKLNAALESEPSLAEHSVEKLLSDLASLPDSVRPAVRNHGGGHANHTLFWEQLRSPDQAEVGPEGDFLTALEATFGSLGEFKEEFETKTAAQFGSGWGWLVKDQAGDLKITTTANQDSPLSLNQVPLLGVDVWEHAYYLKYQNRRPEYLSAIWQVIDWQVVGQRFGAAQD